MKRAARRIRILHIVGGMGRAGVETWLMHILRHADRERFQMDFLVHTAQPCPYDDEVRALGGNIIPCLHPARPLELRAKFPAGARRARPLRHDHRHVHHYSGWVLRLARRAGVPVQDRAQPRRCDARRCRAGPAAAGVPGDRQALDLLAHATIGLACSGVAADALFGKAWRSDARLSLLYYGIDPEPFRAEANGSVRAELGLPADAFVVGHVGRFEEQKNHRFLLEIVREVVTAEPRTRLLLIGAGSLQPDD